MIRAGAVGGGVWHIELRRPAKRNALGVEAYELLADMLGRIGAMRDARAVVLSGEGEAFCAGNDLAEFATHWPQPPGGPVVRFLEALHGLDLPLIAAVQGAAVGMGATLLLHCDLVVAAPDAFLRFPFMGRGITVEGAGSLLLPLRIGYARSMDLLLTGRRVHADEALRLGLITHVSGDQAPVAMALDLARSIAAKPPEAVAATKRLVREGFPEGILARFEQEIQAINELLAISGPKVTGSASATEDRSVKSP